MSKKKKQRHGNLIPPPGNQPTNPQAVAIGASYRGPLPSPEMLRQYDNVLPGMAERLLEAFEKQGDHRRQMDEKSLTMNFRLARVGQVFAFLLGLAGLGSGTYLVSTGHSPEGVAVVFGAIGSLVGAFLWTGRREKPSAQGP